MRTGPIPLFYSQLQTWSKTWSQAGRKHVESQLRTCLKRVFCTFHLSSTRTNQRACCGSRPGFRQKSRKLVESVSQTRTNLSKTWLQTWSKISQYMSVTHSYRVLKNIPPKAFRNIFTSVKSFCMKFCKFVGNSYPHISTNFCRFVLMFHQMALIFPRVPIVFTLSSFE